MPEGPEIHRAADKIAKILEGQVAQEVFFAFEHLKPYENTLAGQVVVSVQSRGKAMLTCFEDGTTVYSHNQLYGRWITRRRGGVPDTNRSLRFAIHNAKHSAFLYSASDIEILAQEDVNTHPYLQKLGPDPLLEEVSEADILQRFKDPKFSRRQLGTLLLDQGFVGGIGNYLRSEILWYAGVHPKAKLSELDPSPIELLAQGTYLLMQRAYETGGVTNEPDRVARMKEDGFRRRDYRHFVFGRENKPCPTCDEVIIRADFASRRVYLCPRCQP